MARNENVSLTAGTWTEITNADVTSITFQCLTSGTTRILGTTGSAPSGEQIGIQYQRGFGERNVLLSDLFPGISAKRVFALSAAGGEIFVSHG